MKTLFYLTVIMIVIMMINLNKKFYKKAMLAGYLTQARHYIVTANVHVHHRGAGTNICIDVL